MTASTFGAIRLPRRMMRLPRDHRGYPVPTVAEWSSEQELILPPPIERPYGHVATSKGAPGVGTPLLGNMAPQRQRRAMLLTRCQVCDRNLSSSGYRFMAGGPMLQWFTEPWLCGPCMTFAVQVCPGLIRAARHSAPLVIHHVDEVEFCQERIGFRPIGLATYEEFTEDADRVAVDAAMRMRQSWLAAFDYEPKVDGFGKYTSMLYFVRARVVSSTVYDVQTFLDRFDWSGELA